MILLTAKHSSVPIGTMGLLCYLHQAAVRQLQFTGGIAPWFAFRATSGGRGFKDILGQEEGL